MRSTSAYTVVTKIRLLLFFITLLELPSVVRSGQTTIDDSQTGGQLVYEGPWDTQQCGLACETPGPLDFTQVHDGTYHIANSSSASMTITFTGTSISLFFVVPDVGLNTSSIFMIDGVQAGFYTHRPSNNLPFYLYNQKVLSVSGLDNIQHVLVATPVAGLPSQIQFDYATYSFPDPQSSSYDPGNCSDDIPSTDTFIHCGSGTIVPGTGTNTASISTPRPTSTFPTSPGPPIPDPSTSAQSSQPSSLDGSSLNGSASSGGSIQPRPSESATGAGGAYSGASKRATVPVGAIVGGSLGGVLLLVLLLWLLCRRRRRRQRVVAFMSNDGEKVPADTTRSVDAGASPVEDVAPQAPRVTAAIRVSQHALDRVHTVRPQLATDSKTLAATRRAVMDAVSNTEPRILERPLSDEAPLVPPSAARIPDVLSTPPPPLSDSEGYLEDLLEITHGVDHDPYFQALNAERVRVAAEVARVDAELARMREEYADGAPPTYISNTGSGGAPTDQAANDISCEAPEELRVSTVRGDKT